MKVISQEINFNLYCYAIAKENTSLAFTHIKTVFTRSIASASSNPCILKGRCSSFIQAFGLISRAVLLCIPLINKISQFASKETVLRVMQKNPKHLQFADKETALAVLKQNGLALEHAHEDLRNSDEVVLIAARQNVLALKYASEYLAHELKRKDRGIILAAARSVPPLYTSNNLSTASTEIKGDKEIALAVLKQGCSVLGYLSEDLQDDREVVLAALKEESPVLVEDITGSNDFYSKSMSVRSSPLIHASKRLQSDKDIVLFAVKRDGMALAYASKSLQNDKEVVLTALATLNRVNKIFKEHPDAWKMLPSFDELLKHASPTLQEDKEILDFVQEMKEENNTLSKKKHLLSIT